MNFRELPNITEKQKEIMRLIFQFRFVNRKQIQRLLNHKDPKRINAWLKDLVDKKYLGRIYSHKLLENTKPAIYYLNNNGIIWAKYEKGEEYNTEDWQLEIKYLKKFYQDKHASITFINHCTSLCEFYVQFKEYERSVNKDRKRNKLEYYFETKTEMWIERQLRLREDEDFNAVKQYIPDLYIEKINNPENKNENTTTFFLEMFDSHIPRYAIKYRIKQYIRFKEEEKEWKYKYTGTDRQFPTILLIFPHQRKINGLTKFISDELSSSYDSGNIRLLLTTYQKAMTQTLLAGSSIWKEIRRE